MKLIFWIKWEGHDPERIYATDFDDFWHRVRAIVLQCSYRLEWIISE
jgi:hypothetical protein